jgi:hypothetical protein
MGRATEQGAPLMQPLLVPMMKAEEWRGRGIMTTPLFILTIACFVCYANTVSCGFVFDDISAIKDNKAREPGVQTTYHYKKDDWLSCF